jgi:hypothetical protein
MKLDLSTLTGSLQVASALAPLIPVENAALIGKAAGLVAELLANLARARGITPAEALALAEIEAEENDRMLLEDAARLHLEMGKDTAPLPQ